MSYSTNPANYPDNTAITANSPTVTGSGITYSVSPALPAGLSLNTSTGVISGTPTTSQAAAVYVVTATNSGGSTTANVTIGITDRYYANVALLLAFEGTNGSTSFLDTSSLAHTVTAIGDAQLSTAQAPTGQSSSLLLDGAGDLLSVPDSLAFEFADRDFTIEFWVRFSTVAGGTSGMIMCKRAASADTSGFVIIRSGDDIICYMSANGTTWGVFSTYYIDQTASANTWTHYSLNRSGNTMYVSKNGVVTNVGAAVGAMNNNTSPLYIGGDSDAFRETGNFGPIRITRGVCRYSANFTAPTLPLNATGDNAAAFLTALAGKTTWMKADAGVTKNGSNQLSNWQDQSSYAQNYAPITGAATDGPLWVAAAYNGLPAIRYDGSASRLNSTAAVDPFHGATSFSAYIVLNQSSTGLSNGCFFNDYDGSGTTRVSFQRSGANNVFLHTNDTVNSAGTNAVVVEDAITQVAAIRDSNVSHKAYTKGVLQATDVTPGAVAMLSKKMGIGCQGSVGNLLWKGDLCELLICGSLHDQATQVAVEMALAKKWAIS